MPVRQLVERSFQQLRLLVLECTELRIGCLGVGDDTCER